MGGMEAVITGLSDDFKILKRNRKIFTFATAFGTFLVAILCVTNVSLLGLCHFILSLTIALVNTMFGQYHNMKIHLLIFVFCHIINIKFTKFYI